MISYKFKKFLVYCNKFYSKLHAVKSSLETDILAKKIVTKLLSKPDTVYLMSPSGRYYLQTGDKRFFVVISDNFIKITNHKYTYENQISIHVSGELIGLICKALERSRLKMEKEIFKSEVNVLNEILNS
jgi:hypothetical protein